MIDIYLHQSTEITLQPDFTIDENVPSELDELLRNSRRLLMQVQDLEQLAGGWIGDEAMELLAELAKLAERSVVMLMWRPE